MKIQAGKYYVTRDGRKVGPVREQNGYLTTHGWHYAENGECCHKGISGNEKQPEFDIISEWQEGPIREVHRREIVPGVYGAIYVDGSHAGNMVGLQFFEKSSHAINILTAEQLLEAAHLFNQLAEVLEEQG